MAHDSRVIANALLDRARERGGLTPMQLIKLVYLCHGWMLGIFRRPLLTDDVEAWQYGPVIRRVYDQVKGGSLPIKENLLVPQGEPSTLTPEEMWLIDQVVEKYGRFNGVALSRLTHMSDTPWARTWAKFGQNAVIPQDWIEEHFAEIVHGTSERAASA